MLDKTRSAKLEDCAKSTTWVMPLRILSKFFIIIMRLNNAANIAKHRKRKTTRHPFRTIVHKIAKNLCVFVLSYRRLIREDGDHGSSLGGVDLVRLKRVDLVRRVCGTIPWKVSAADQVRHRKVDLVRYGGIAGERRSWRRRWGWTRLLPGAKECSGAPGRPQNALPGANQPTIALGGNLTKEATPIQGVAPGSRSSAFFF